MPDGKENGRRVPFSFDFFSGRDYKEHPQKLFK